MSGMRQHSDLAEVGVEETSGEAARPSARVVLRQATSDRILDGAERALSRKGARATSMEDVARESGVTRMTVYRHYASREQLMNALTEREMNRYYEEMIARSMALESAALPDTNPVCDLLVDAVQFTLAHFRAHPVVTALIENDPDLILPVWTTRADKILGMAVAASAPGFARWSEMGWIKPLSPEWLAEWLTRLVMSWHMQPSVLMDPHDPETTRRLVETFVWPVIDPGPVRSASA